MKYFTMEWWKSQQNLDFKDNIKLQDPHLAYSDYFNSILKDFPDRLFCFHKDYSLHDGDLRALNISLLPSALTMIIEVDNEHNVGNFTLQYKSLLSFKIIRECGCGFTGAYGFGDCGYVEIDKVGQFEFTHRILFASGIEFEINFSEFDFLYRADL